MVETKALKNLASALKSGQKSDATRTLIGSVRAIDSEYVWVESDGSLIPCERSTVSVSTDNEVVVSIQNGEATITGNVTAPSTDDSTAEEAKKDAVEASKTATNYLDFNEVLGLIVGNISGAKLNGNVQLTQDGNAGVVNLRDGDEVVASFMRSGISFADIDFQTLEINGEGAISFVRCPNGVIFCEKAPSEHGYNSAPKIKISGEGIEGLGYGITSSSSGYMANVEITTGTPYKTLTFLLDNQNAYPILKGWRSSSSSIVPYGVYFELNDNGKTQLVIKLRNVSSSKATATITAEVDYIN